MASTPNRELWRDRVQDTMRHLEDLRYRTYEGAESRADREAVYLRGFELVTPVATRVLDDLNEWLLENQGTVTTTPPHDDGANGLIGMWSLSWPRLEKAINQYTGHAPEAVRLVAVFPAGWTHAHLARPHAGMPAEVTAWPMQVLNEEDAERQEPVLRVLAETELHERVYQAYGDWQLTRPLKS